MKFHTDGQGNIIGAYGPGNEYFTKVEQHSSIKYNLNGVEPPKKNAHCNDNDNDTAPTVTEEKEG
eukprot:CAMPEP_0197067546 /NCGR_PEP_ID=MMETSP1384-20130603/180895_1 /TAXON_ID=29189 /ORGANISM="Ammonia sp." /LENGTH=64 /DNA_ID=CAMNT_0042505035 /DNA_START=25 /DNA_END=215 /DNA_ORIENTATION=-